MLGLGIISILLGLAGVIYGSYLNNDWEAQLESLFSNGSTNPGTLFIIVGGALIGVGVILIIADIAKKSRPTTNVHSAPESITRSANSNQRAISHMKAVCPSCGKRFESAAMISFCPSCGSRLDSSSSASTEPPKPVVSVCSKCGAKLLKDGSCPNCDATERRATETQHISTNNTTATGLKPTRWAGE